MVRAPQSRLEQSTATVSVALGIVRFGVRITTSSRTRLSVPFAGMCMARTERICTSDFAPCARAEGLVFNSGQLNSSSKGITHYVNVATSTNLFASPHIPAARTHGSTPALSRAVKCQQPQLEGLK